MASDVTATVIFHREGSLAIPALASMAAMVEVARNANLQVEARAVLDRPDQLTRRIVGTAGAWLDGVQEVDVGDLGLSRNAGVAAASGEWLCFLDGDDLWGADWIVAAKRAANGAAKDTVWHPKLLHYFVEADFDRQSHTPDPHPQVQSFLMAHIPDDEPGFDIDCLFLNNLWTANVFAHRSVHESAPYRPVRRDLGFGVEDWSWHLETAWRGLPHRVVPDTIHFIRVKASGSLGQQNASEGLLPQLPSGARPVLGRARQQRIRGKATVNRPAVGQSERDLMAFIERLEVSREAAYSPIEAAIHVARYALALPYAAGCRVLDLACGEGYGSKLLLDAEAREVVGVDIAATAIDKARELFTASNLSFHAAAADALPEAVEAGGFDLIVSIETVEHVRDGARFLDTLRRLGHERTVFVITCPNDHWYYRPDEGNPYHLCKYTFDEFRAIAEKALGNRVTWLLGAPSFGFQASTWPNQEPGGPTSPLVQPVSVSPSLRVPGGAESVTPEQCSYFAGIWNAPQPPRESGAYFNMPMDRLPALLEVFNAQRDGREVASAAEISRWRAEERELMSLRHSVLDLERALAFAVNTGRDAEAGWADERALLDAERDRAVGQCAEALARSAAASAERDRALAEAAQARAERDALAEAAARWNALTRRARSAFPGPSRLAATWLRRYLNRRR